MCIRIMDPNQDTNPDYTSINIDHKGAAPGDVQLSQVLPNGNHSQDAGFDGSSLSRGNTAPRLSIQSGNELNNRETVDLWRKWNLKSRSGRVCRPPSHFVIIVSVEDTGAARFHHAVVAMSTYLHLIYFQFLISPITFRKWYPLPSGASAVPAFFSSR